jgi:hypothetical protein
MIVLESTPEGLRDQIWSKIASVNDTGWLARSADSRFGVMLGAAPESGYTEVLTNLRGHPFFGEGSENLMIASDPTGEKRALRASHVLHIANLYGLDEGEYYDGPLHVVDSREKPITPNLIAMFSALVTSTEFRV